MKLPLFSGSNKNLSMSYVSRLILSLLLVCLVLLANVNYSGAAELYYQFNIHEIDEFFQLDYSDPEHYDSNEPVQGYTGFEEVLEDGFAYFVMEGELVYIEDSGSGEVYQYVNPNNPTSIYEYELKSTDPYIVTRKVIRVNLVRRAGNQVGTTIAPLDTYPSDGIQGEYWYIRGNLATPEAPSSISVVVPPNLDVGSSIEVLWEESKFAQGYILERSINDSNYFSLVYSGESTSFTDIIQSHWYSVTYRVYAYNGSERGESITSDTLTINFPPELILINPIQGDYFSEGSRLEISGSITDKDIDQRLTVKYSIDGVSGHTDRTLRPLLIATGSSQDFSYHISLDNIPDGIYNLRVWVEDEKGAKSREIIREIRIDKTPPELVPTGVPVGWVNHDILLTITARDVGNFQSGVQRIGKPDGSWVNVPVTTFLVTGNGEYPFIVQDVAGNITVMSVVIENIDKGEPNIVLLPSITTPTNQNVEITAKGVDILSGVREIILPDGTSIHSSEASYVVSENGNYIFRVIDNAGNENYGNIEISNIDREHPVITIEPYDTDWTNQNITVRASTNKGILNATSYTFTENGSFVFVATDLAGNRTEREVIVTNIDKEAPTLNINMSTDEPTNTDVVVTVEASDKGSGIRGVILPDGSMVYSSSVNFNVSENGTYEFKAVDNVGNEVAKSITVSNIDKSTPVVKIGEFTDDAYSTKIDSPTDKSVVPIVVDIYVKPGKSGLEKVEYAITESKNLPNSWSELNVVRNGDRYEGEVVITERGKDLYVHVRAINKAGSEGLGYRGVYRINIPIELIDLRIDDNDSGVLKLIDETKPNKDNTIVVHDVGGSVEAYVLKKNTLMNLYRVDIKNEDNDSIRIRYTIKNRNTNEIVNTGETTITDGSYGYMFNVAYFNNLSDNWDDGVYEVNVEASDFDRDFSGGPLSTASAKLYVLLKRSSPPRPEFVLNEDKTELEIIYPEESGGVTNLFNHPDIQAYYKNQYYIGGREGLANYTGPITINRSTTVTAIHTDLVGNESRTTINIVVDRDRGGIVRGEGNVDVVIEETRYLTKYFINIRKHTNEVIDESIFDFLRF